jgi:flagellar motor component MotA
MLKHIKTSNEKFWFVAETCMAIGMMGTVLGFILMLGGSNLESIDPTDVEGMKNVIGQLASGMATALLTTLTGLIVSVSLRTQLMIGEGE